MAGSGNAEFASWNSGARDRRCSSSETTTRDRPAICAGNHLGRARRSWWEPETGGGPGQEDGCMARGPAGRGPNVNRGSPWPDGPKDVGASRCWEPAEGDRPRWRIPVGVVPDLDGGPSHRTRRRRPGLTRPGVRRNPLQRKGAEIRRRRGPARSNHTARRPHSDLETRGGSSWLKDGGAFILERGTTTEAFALRGRAPSQWGFDRAGAGFKVIEGRHTARSRSA